MAKVLTDPQHYTNIANAIRAKKGTSETLTPGQMAAEISGIFTGLDLPEKIVYFNNMEGAVYSEIVAKYGKYDGSSTSIVSELDTSAKWGDASCAKLYDGTNRYEINLYDPNNPDNGFGDPSSKGLTQGGWFRRVQSIHTYERALIHWGANAGGVYIAPDSDKWSVEHGGTGKSIGGIISPIEAIDMWVHLALSVDPVSNPGYDNVTFYINGYPQVSFTTGQETTYRIISIGSATRYTWPGYVKNAFLSRGVLTEAEIRTMMFCDKGFIIRQKISLQDKTVTQTSEQQTITADEGFDGLGTVTVGAVEVSPTAESSASET